MLKFRCVKKITLLTSVCAFFYFQSIAENFRIHSVSEFERVQRKADPNDTIVWEKGKYIDIEISLRANGIFFVAEKPGETIFSGNSTFRIEGNGNTISGFQFVGGKIEGDVIDISGSNNTIELVNIQSYDAHYYLRVRPNCQYNIISYCNFESKPETQESSVVQIEATEDLPGYHSISYCSFKNHTAPPDAGGDFGIEALRIGYSYQRTFISRTIVEYCYFEKCNGDYEVISNKACENILRYNTFINNGPAHLTLRHGSRNMVYGNFFINGAGVRIKEGQNQVVINNYFDTGEQMAISLQNHPFDPVERVNISNNTFISYSSLKLGGSGDYPPKAVSFTNNLFSSTIDSIFTDPTGTETWRNNVIQKNPEIVDFNGFIVVSLDFARNEFGYFEPGFKLNSLKEIEFEVPKIFDIPELDDDFVIEFDIVKQRRMEKFSHIPGCFLPAGEESIRPYANEKNTGPIYLTRIMY